MNYEIENITKWQTLNSLNQLYLSKETNKTSSDELFWKYLQDYQRIDMSKYKSKIIATDNFKNYYEAKIQRFYNELYNFIEQNNIEELIGGFLISDINVLIKLEKQKEQILSDNLTRKQISSKHFSNGDAKYLKGNLEKAVKKILNIEHFPEDNKEQQFISILHSKESANKIILCENSDRLVNPRMKFTEIWYAGGKNTAKLKYVPKPTIPIYYLCDWDFDGLTTYLRIKNEYFSNLQLIIPDIEVKKSIEKTDHKSKWKTNFNINTFNPVEQEIIKQLIPNYWIEEESLDIQFEK